ncbi:acyltransferase [Pseudomonas sp. 2FG]|uniref:acyltransferase family protein n=1 Tax=Pseudomonas sp. 2FG TaxID=2502191 RepID=UPI0010FA5588|nr:acyltransferase [Pseudomonas sp. 2FG]
MIGDGPIRFIAADGIRGLACLIVLLVHAVAVFFPASFPYLKGCGKIGVWLFFVLSAFLLSHKLLLSQMRPLALVNYGLGRFLRIIPLFMLAVLVYAWVGLVSWQKTIDALLFNTGLMHFWTIPVEFKFYAILPLLLWCLIAAHRFAGWKGAVVFTVIFIAVHQALFPFWELQESSIFTSWYVPSFIFGCTGAVIYTKLSTAISGRASLYIGIGILLLMILSSPGARFYLFGIPMTDDLMNKHIPFSLLWLFFIMALIDGRGWLGAVLRTAPISMIGKWSYSIYLFHFLMLLKLSATHKNSIAWMALAIIASVAIGALSYYLAERPLEFLRGRMQLRYLSSKYETGK